MFLRKIITAIGRVLGTTHPVGRVVPPVDFPIGGDKPIVEQQLQPATKESKAKRSNVKAAILAPSPKAETLLVPTRTKKSKVNGTQPATLVPPFAPSKRSNKPKAAQSTKAAKSSSKGKQSAHPVNGEVGKPSKTRAAKTRQHAK